MREPWLRSDACFGTRAIVDLAALSGFEAQTLRLATRTVELSAKGASGNMHAAALHGVPGTAQVAPQAQTCLRRLFSDRSRSRSSLRMTATAKMANAAPSGCAYPPHALPVRRPGRTAPGLLCIRQRPAEHLIRRTAGLA